MPYPAQTLFQNFFIQNLCTNYTDTLTLYRLYFRRDQRPASTNTHTRTTCKPIHQRHRSTPTDTTHTTNSTPTHTTNSTSIQPPQTPTTIQPPQTAMQSPQTHATPGPPTLTTLTPTHRRCRSTNVDAAPVGSQLDRPGTRQDQSTHSQLNRPGTRQDRIEPDQNRPD